jgi:hypothetical protein
MVGFSRLLTSTARRDGGLTSASAVHGALRFALQTVPKPRSFTSGCDRESARLTISFSED